MSTTTKKIIFAAFSVLIIGVSIFFGKYQNVNAGVKEDQTFGDWVVKCDKSEKKEADKNKPNCFLMQQVNISKDDKTEKTVAKYQVGYFKAEKSVKMIQHLPLGIYLPAGTGIITEQKELTASSKFTTCDATGCYASVELQDEVLDKLFASSVNSLSFIGIDSEQVNLPISIKGLQEGIKALKK